MVLIGIVQIYLSIRSYRKYSKWVQICIPIPGMMFQFASFTSIFSRKIFFHHDNWWPIWKSTPPIFYPNLLEKKNNAVHIKTPSILILTRIFSQIHRNTRKVHFKILAFSVYNVSCKITACKTKKKFRLAPQKILGFDPKLSDLLREIWFCQLLKLLVKCPQKRSYVI